MDGTKNAFSSWLPSSGPLYGRLVFLKPFHARHVLEITETSQASLHLAAARNKSRSCSGNGQLNLLSTLLDVLAAVQIKEYLFIFPLKKRFMQNWFVVTSGARNVSLTGKVFCDLFDPLVAFLFARSKRCIMTYIYFSLSRWSFGNKAKKHRM